MENTYVDENTYRTPYGSTVGKTETEIVTPAYMPMGGKRKSRRNKKSKKIKRKKTRKNCKKSKRRRH